IAAYVVWRIADSAAFPELDPNTLLLMGVSQGTYIGGKIASTSPLSRAQAIKLELETAAEALENAKKRKDELEKLKRPLETKQAASPLNADETAQLDGYNKELTA